MSIPSTATLVGSTATDQPSLVAAVLDTLRGQVRRVVPAARGVVSRIGDHVESFMGAKIRRRVKPPIVLAIVVASLALAAAVVALIRK